jgi:hypothetical protein
MFAIRRINEYKKVRIPRAWTIKPGLVPPDSK